MTKNKFKNTDVADSFHLNEDCAFYCWQFFLCCLVQMEEKFDHFCKAFAVGSSLAKLVRSVWLLDHGNMLVSAVVNICDATVR